MSTRKLSGTVAPCLFLLVVAGAYIPAVAGPSTGQLDAAFAGFTSVDEVKVSGLTSSYYTDIMGGDPLPDTMFTLGTSRVSYPSGIGTRPSPAGSIGRVFDEGMLGIMVDGDDLIVRVAGGLDPQTGYWHTGWSSWYGQGDVFLTVEDDTISQYALLNSWVRDESGTPRDLSSFGKAKSFHIAGDSGSSLEGHLVELTDDDQVALVGGAGTYYPGYGATPTGLDFRVYAQGGKDLGDASLTHTSVTDYGLGDVQQTWYVQTWTVPLEWLSGSDEFTIGLHKAASCGNDQIALLTSVAPTSVVPAPPAVLLGLLGVSMAGWISTKRSGKDASRT